VSSAPRQKNVDYGFRDPLACLIELLGAVGLHSQELRQGQSEAAQHSDIEELSPGIVPRKGVSGTRYLFHGLTYAEMLGFLRD
jgi:hypothetical protein